MRRRIGLRLLRGGRLCVLTLEGIGLHHLRGGLVAGLHIGVGDLRVLITVGRRDRAGGFAFRRNDATGVENAGCCENQHRSADPDFTFAVSHRGPRAVNDGGKMCAGGQTVNRSRSHLQGPVFGLFCDSPLGLFQIFLGEYFAPPKACAQFSRSQPYITGCVIGFRALWYKIDGQEPWLPLVFHHKGRH